LSVWADPADTQFGDVPDVPGIEKVWVPDVKPFSEEMPEPEETLHAHPLPVHCGNWFARHPDGAARFEKEIPAGIMDALRGEKDGFALIPAGFPKMQYGQAQAVPVPPDVVPRRPMGLNSVG
jgi:hypothetical protein